MNSQKNNNILLVQTGDTRSTLSSSLDYHPLPLSTLLPEAVTAHLKAADLNGQS